MARETKRVQLTSDILARMQELFALRDEIGKDELQRRGYGNRRFAAMLGVTESTCCCAWTARRKYNEGQPLSEIRRHVRIINDAELIARMEAIGGKRPPGHEDVVETPKEPDRQLADEVAALRAEVAALRAERA